MMGSGHLNTETSLAPMPSLGVVPVPFRQCLCPASPRLHDIPFDRAYLMVLPVLRRIHWGIGRFCFCALASFCFTRKVLWLCGNARQLLLSSLVPKRSFAVLVGEAHKAATPSRRNTATWFL